MNHSFSIIIPCYNHGLYLSQNLQSLLNQDFHNWEAHIINDGSIDETESIAMNFSKQDSRINYWYQSNCGLANARNKGINHSKNDWIIFLDADDYLKPFTLNILNNYTNHSDIILGGYDYVDEAGRLIHSVKQPNLENAKSILTTNIVPPASIAVRRSFLNQTGLFDYNLKNTGTEDWDLWIRFYKAGARFSIIPQSIANYRILPLSMSRNAARMYDALKEVTLRASKKDERVGEDMPLNLDYDIDPLPAIKRCLLMCLGVSVMQGKVSEAVLMFEKEVHHYDFKFIPADFAYMCSYLSFRYRENQNDVCWILKDLRPLYIKFLQQAGFDRYFIASADKHLFRRVRMLQNRHRWGVLSPVINRLWL
ncbi:MAG: glycosyltransferase [Bacteroidetes bacterium]|nr:glycosyltransferase [Bacteroidota bacterium]